jgi:HIRAN domain
MSALFVAWRPPMPEQNGWRPVGCLEYDGHLYRFCYTRGALEAGFQPFQGMPSFDQIYESDELFPLFANRLLSRSRPEYDSFLRWSGFDPANPPDPIVILGVSEGIRETDAVEVFPRPVPDSEGCYLNKFFLHGIRWLPQASVERTGRLRSGETLKLMLDFQNARDPHAVAVRTEEERMVIGYVPRYLARDVWELVQSCDRELIQLSVQAVNADAPLQNRVLCRMRACWPDAFRPCSGPEFAQIPTTVPARHQNVR